MDPIRVTFENNSPNKKNIELIENKGKLATGSFITSVNDRDKFNTAYIYTINRINNFINNEIKTPAHGKFIVNEIVTSRIPDDNEGGAPRKSRRTRKYRKSHKASKKSKKSSRKSHRRSRR